MRTRLLLVVSLALALMALAVPARAAGTETQHFSLDGLFADAFFSSTDPSGCVSTVVDLLANDGRSRIGSGQPTVGARAIIIVAQFDNCTQTLLLAADGSAVLGPGELQIDNKLTTATLTATVEVFDVVSGASFPVDVNVSWTGVGGTTSTRTHTRQTLPGFKVNERFESTFREAIASGTVSDGTTNFTPQPAPPGDAHLASVKQGEVDITRQ
jgi:hypothetical protein